MKNDHDEYDGFAVKIFLDEDGDYLAHFIELPNVSAFGKTPSNALLELKMAWELMKECYQEDNEPIPKPTVKELNDASCSIPVPPQLYLRLTDEAVRAGISINTLVEQKLTENSGVVT